MVNVHGILRVGECTIANDFAAQIVRHLLMFGKLGDLIEIVNVGCDRLEIIHFFLYFIIRSF